MKVFGLACTASLLSAWLYDHKSREESKFWIDTWREVVSQWKDFAEFLFSICPKQNQIKLRESEEIHNLSWIYKSIADIGKYTENQHDSQH